jgi:hypothetical protein
MREILLTLGILLSSDFSFAHGDHVPPIASCQGKECSKEQIENAVPIAIQILVKMGKIESNWSSSKIEKVEQKKFEKGTEWVASIFDANQKDQTKQRLYIFITNKGYLSGSNYTGN